ncbi:sulfatase-like hydrolase/transferase [Roseibacillus persicicus]|uniref:sulfatase-like hydrolase/transferase n=1 Tax=Roseibacillus persicicus TaxID=454148 RepID=UPI00398BB37A
MKPLLLLLALLLSFPLIAAPITDSWLTKLSGRYARIYPDNEARDAQAPVTTWARGQGVQALPTYAGVSEVSATESDVYIRTSNLGFHIMGPWYGETGNLFPNYPANRAVLYRFPRTPVIPSEKALTGLGAIGYFVDGISMFDSRDAFSYDNSAGVDDGPTAGAGVNGDGVWNRDAFVNESPTFDAANAHQAGPTHHYHANPPALRHLLGGSVTYEEASNTYTESPNGEHSPIIGWVRDGLPVYGPYAYSDPTDPQSPVRRMISGYQKRDGSNGSTNLTPTGRTTRPQWQVRNEGLPAALATNQYGPAVSAQYVLGHYLEDYAYKGDLGLTLYEGSGTFDEALHFDLNEYNVRWGVTPDFPDGTWAYFTCIDPVGTPVFPYNISRYFFGEPKGDNTTTIPATAETIFEGGPEKELTFQKILTADESGDVTLVWDSAEGGNYTLSSSESLDEDWQPFARVAGADATTSLVDSARLSADEQQFYQITLDYLQPFDDAGFNYDDSLVSTGPQHNVLLLIVDDWGLDASELYNTEPSAQLANMPNLKALAESGLLFTRGYSQALCSPTRATILTGRQPYQHGVGNPQSDSTLPASELTFPEIIANEVPEYGLASFGKWHLGSGETGPFETGGWPHFSGTLVGGLPDYYDWSRVELKEGVLTDAGTTTSTYATTAQVDAAVSFINEQGDDPWVVWMGFNAPHTPFQDPPANLAPAGGYSITGDSNTALYIRMLEALDTEIGRLLQSVDLASTNIIVIGDNGTPGQVDQAPAGGLAGAKGNLTEGGIHVPFFAHGPDIIHTGTTDKLVHVVDLFSTVLELTGINVSAATDGIELHSRSLVPIFNGNDFEERCIISEQFNSTIGNGRALIIDQWPHYKLISSQDVTDPDDTPSYQMYELGANGMEISTLTTPPNPGDPWEEAYSALVAKDASLQPFVTTTQTVYLELPNATGPAGVPQNEALLPTAVTIDGIDVLSIEGRLDQDDNYDRVWVKVLVPAGQTITPATANAVVTFTDNPNTGDPRVFTAIQVLLTT